LVKQYKKLFGFEHVNLRFTEEALKSVAAEALCRKTGARGLRSILESCMLDIMYDLPDIKSLQEVIVNEDVVLRNASCILVFEKEAESAS
jgi:ATP-dependent Clp protease ATP-binding subunit ClpX